MNIYSSVDSDQVLLDMVKSIGRHPVEFVGFYTGTGEKQLDQFVVPDDYVSVNIQFRNKLHDFFGDTSISGKSQLVKGSDGRYKGVYIYPDNNKNDGILIPPSQIDLPHGRDISYYLKPDTDIELQIAMWGMGLDSKEKSQGSIRLTDDVYRVALSDNQFYNGRHGDKHLHLSVEKKYASTYYERMIREYNHEYFTYFSPEDIEVARMNDQKMAILGMPNMGGIMIGVSALTPNGTDIMGSSYLDFSEILDDRKTAERFFELTKNALNPKNIDDKFKFFDMQRNLRTETPPWYVKSDNALYP